MGGSESEPTDHGDSSEKKKLLARTDAKPTYAQMKSMDKDDEVVGTDIVNVIAEAAVIEVEFKNISWGALFSAVNSD